MSGRSLERVTTAKAEIESSGIKGTLSAIQLDITDDASISKAVDYVSSTHGHVDVLFNNAAVGARDDDLRTRFQRSFESNILGPALVAQEFRPLLLKSQNPYSIFVSSGVGSIGLALKSIKYGSDEAYRMSKSALNMIMVCEHRDFSPKGLKVFGMCPGFVVSNLRGTSEEERNPGGQAGDPMESGKLMLSIIQGKLDEHVGRVINKNGVVPW